MFMEYSHHTFKEVLHYISENEPVNFDYRYEHFSHLLYLYDEKFIDGYVTEKDSALKPLVFVNVTLRDSGKLFLLDLNEKYKDDSEESGD